jgi:hypothetical protein
MEIPIPLSWKALPSPRARLNWAEIPFGIVFAVLLRFVAVKAGFIAKSNSVTSQFLTNIWFGVLVLMLPGLL